MYSSLADMVARFGNVEMVRLTTPTGEPMTMVSKATVVRALTEASAVIDSYIRRRYATPIVAELPEITRAAAILARYDLAHGDDREPSKQMGEQRTEVLDWLKGIRDGAVLLDLTRVPSSDESHATAQTRDAAYGTGASATGWLGGA